MDSTGRSTLQLPEASVSIHSLRQVADEAGVDLARLPHTVKILLENLLRRRGSRGAPGLSRSGAWDRAHVRPRRDDVDDHLLILRR